CSLGLAVASDDELLLVEALHLDPGGRAGLRVGGAAAFGDDAFEAVLADALEDGGAVAPEGLAQAEPAFLPVADELFEQGEPLFERGLGQVLPVAPGQVEGEEDDRLAAAAVDRVLEGLEVADAAGVENDGLTVEDGVDAEAFANGGGDVGE